MEDLWRKKRIVLETIIELNSVMWHLEPFDVSVAKVFPKIFFLSLN